MQLGRVDERVDPAFDDEVALEVIEKGSAVQCISTFEGALLAQPTALLCALMHEHTHQHSFRGLSVAVA